MSPTASPPVAVSLYLRNDGSLLLVRDSHTIEMALTPRQLVDLGFDALRFAFALDPNQIGAIAEALDSIVPFPADMPPVEGTLCRIQ